MMSGITKRVLAITICIAMLTGSIPANAEGTVSGSAIPTVTDSSTVDNSSSSDLNNDKDSDANSESDQDKDDNSESDTNKTIEDENTPTGPAPSTDGTGSVPGGTVSGNKGDQTTVSENKNTETVSENKAEETVSDNSVSDNSVSGNSVSDNSVSDNTLSGNSIEYLTWSETVDGVTITVSANKLSVPEGTDLSVAQLDPVEVEVLENTIAEEEQEQSIVIKKYKAFDITLVNDGEPVTPSEEVKVTFTGDIMVNELEEGDKLKVYHLDDSDTKVVTNEETGEKTEVATLNDMQGDVASDAVVMDTPHFSTYLIALQSEQVTYDGLIKNKYISITFDDDIVEKYSIYEYKDYGWWFFSNWKWDKSYDNNKSYVQVRVYVNNELREVAPKVFKEENGSIKTFVNYEGESSDYIQLNTGNILNRNINFRFDEENYNLIKVVKKAGNTYNALVNTGENLNISDNKSTVSLAKYSGATHNYLDVYLEKKGGEIQPKITVDKKAKLINWNDRTYDITLSASAINATPKGANVVLVLDYSSSMYSNQEKLELAAKSFIDKLKGTNTKVGVVRYGNIATNVSNGLIQIDIGSNCDTLKGKIDNLYTEKDKEGTNMGAGLNMANGFFDTEVLNSSPYNYIVLFSDGEPTLPGNGYNINDQSIKSAIENAFSIKNKEIVLYSAYFGNEDDNKKFLQKWVATYNIEKPNSYTFDTSNPEELKSLLVSISSIIIKDISATVKDFINKSFEFISMSDGSIITPSNESGEQVLVWNVPIKELVGNKTWNWTKTFRIKAKPEFLGDNNVYTNSSGSGITVGTSYTPFPLPVVNVKVQYILGSAYDVIFKGEVLASYLQANSNKNITSLLTSVTPYVDKNGLAINYSDTSKFDYEWYQDANNDSIIDQGESLQIVNGLVTLSNSISTLPSSIGSIDDAGIYKLRVKYLPSATTLESKANSLTNVVDSDNAYADATYTVDQISGKIAVTKQIKKSEIDLTQGDPIFGFELKRTVDTAQKETYYKYVRFSDLSGEDDNLSLTTVFDDLPYGTYELDEVYTLRYGKKTLLSSGIESGSPSNLTGTKVVYLMNVPAHSAFTKQADVTTWFSQWDVNENKKIDGIATYKNEKTYSNNFSDTDVVVNKFTLKVGSDGKEYVGIDKDYMAGTSSEQGNTLETN